MEAGINFVVMGLGHIGKRHAEMVLRQKGAHLVAIIDVLSQDSLDLGDYTGLAIPHFYTFSEFLASGLQAQVLNVCTPNGLHAEHALAALNAGLHVVIEKPMALNLADCEAMIKACQQAGTYPHRTPSHDPALMTLIDPAADGVSHQAIGQEGQAKTQ